MNRPPSDPETRERILKANGTRYVKQCACYVRYIEDADVLFCLRLGSHNPTCPAYRASLDPVDRRADDDFRARAEISQPSTSDWGKRS